MIVTVEQRTATLSFQDDRPVTLLWDHKRWQVLDAPTRIGAPGNRSYSPLITHPPRPWAGWRFTAPVDDRTQTYVFDLRETNCNSYEVLGVYE